MECTISTELCQLQIVSESRYSYPSLSTFLLNGLLCVVSLLKNHVLHSMDGMVPTNMLLITVEL